MGCLNGCLVESAEDPGPCTPSLGIEDFAIEKVIGKGAFGRVYLVTRKDTGEVYAMKCLRKDLIEEKHQQAYAMSERRILGKVACPYIVQLKCAFQTLDKLYMVMEFVNGGELFVHLRKASHFSEPRARLYAAELLLALEHLHSQGIIYRDLKPENVLLDLEGHVKLTDFGLSKVLGRKQAFSFCGTPEYIAPEILLGKGYDYSVDFWSFGCLVYEMLSGVPPFYSRNPELTEKNDTTQ